MFIVLGMFWLWGVLELLLMGGTGEMMIEGWRCQVYRGQVRCGDTMGVGVGEHCSGGVGVEQSTVQWWVWVCQAPITTCQPGCALGSPGPTAWKYNLVFFNQLSFVSFNWPFRLEFRVSVECIKPL